MSHGKHLTLFLPSIDLQIRQRVVEVAGNSLDRHHWLSQAVGVAAVVTDVGTHGNEQICPGQVLLLTSELLLLLRRSRWLSVLDFALVLGAELLQLLLLSRLEKLAGLRPQGEHWLVVRILGCLPAALYLTWTKTPLSAVGN